MRIALATCSDLPDGEVDDAPLHEAFEARGVQLSHPAWDDPSFDWMSVDACLIRTTWDYMERRAEFLAWADHVGRQTRLFNSADIVRWNTHKSYLQELAGRGIPTLPTCWLDAGSSVDIANLLRKTGWSRGFLKPAIGATARETLRFDDDDAGIAAATEHLDRILPHEDMLLQPYQETVEDLGEYSLIVIDGEVTHAVRKVPVPGDYRVQSEFGAHDELVTPTDKEITLTHRIVAAVGAPDLLYARVDFLRDAAGAPNLIELELVEPSLFLRHAPHAAGRLADGLLERVATGRLDDTIEMPSPANPGTDNSTTNDSQPATSRP